VRRCQASPGLAWGPRILAAGPAVGFSRREVAFACLIRGTLG
jgi:hypothetical protein